jgi:hypothetical protein
MVGRTWARARWLIKFWFSAVQFSAKPIRIMPIIRHPMWSFAERIFSMPSVYLAWPVDSPTGFACIPPLLGHFGNAIRDLNRASSAIGVLSAATSYNVKPPLKLPWGSPRFYPCPFYGALYLHLQRERSASRLFGLYRGVFYGRDKSYCADGKAGLRGELHRCLLLPTGLCPCLWPHLVVSLLC